MSRNFSKADYISVNMAKDENSNQKQSERNCALTAFKVRIVAI